MTDNRQFSSRRKSCEQCVKAKRRCDTRTPCRRCCQRGLDCQYPPARKSPIEPSLDESHAPKKTMINGLELDQFVLAHYTSPLYDTLDTIVTYQLSKSSLTYCVRQLQGCIQTLARTSQTPFIKRSTWTSPNLSPVHEAFSVAASYNSKNAQNEDFIHEFMLRKSSEIFHTDYWTFEEHLAGAQAMVLFQIIQLFDGDIRLRAVAEAQRPILQEQIIKLQQRQEYEIPEVLSSSPWLKWTFLESVRRCVVAYWFVEAIYGALKTGYCELVPLLATLPIATNGRLWNAANEEEWYSFTDTVRKCILPYGSAMSYWTMSLKRDGPLESFQDALYVACKGNPDLKFE